ncbi:hypothetical protein TanjilG_27478 [Lupinus angustifolius]|uniref:Uncharacterized protein n=1 Tax=Lupinus angustifolius TaxID=3871 RepID=A0A4P1R2W6_LUPAN|nr:hypothetical protein TanjilG_27478 [Lupinus angustifolius]
MKALLPSVFALWRGYIYKCLNSVRQVRNPSLIVLSFLVQSYLQAKPVNNKDMEKEDTEEDDDNKVQFMNTRPLSF